MKRIIALLLVFSTVCLTACNKESIDTTAATGKTEQTESTNITTQTTEANQQTNTNQTEDTNQTVETTRQTNTNQTTETSETTASKIEIPSKEEFVQIGKVGKFINMQSRILFQQRYGNSDRLAYYSKADGEAYIFCFDPLCEHKSDCSSLPGMFSQLSYCENNNRFYLTDRFQLSSFSFDGIDYEKSFLEGIDRSIRLEDTKAYKQYIYISALLQTEEKHQLRYDTNTQKTIDLTEKTGLYSKISYFYDGYIYGIWQYPDPQNPDLFIYQYGRTDLNFENFEVVEAPSFNYLFAEGDELIGFLEGSIIIYNVETEKQTVISKDMIGREVSYLLGADEKYFYFVDHSEPAFFKGKNKTVLNRSGGRLYRVNRDGSQLVCIYENENFDILQSDICIYEDMILLRGQMIGFQGPSEEPYTWNQGAYIGYFQEDGTMDSLEWVEVIA